MRKELDKGVDVCYTNSSKEVVSNTHTEREVDTMMKRISKMIGNTVLVVSALLGVWLLASWIDVVTHNLSPNPIYQSWNLFALMVGYH